jgi:hypothetical protein
LKEIFAAGSRPPELLVGFWKKGSGKPSIDWPQAREQALCTTGYAALAARKKKDLGVFEPIRTLNGDRRIRGHRMGRN